MTFYFRLLIIISLVFSYSLKADDIPLTQLSKLEVSGDYFVSYGRWDSAKLIYIKQLKNLPKDSIASNIKIRQKLLWSYLFLRENDSIEKEIKTLNQLFWESKDTVSSSFLRFNLLRSNCYLTLKKWKTAEAFSRTSQLTFSILDPESLDMVLYLINEGIHQKRTRKFKNAYNSFEKAENLYSRLKREDIFLYLKLLNEKASCYLSELKYFEAQECLEKAINLQYKNPNLWEYNWRDTYKYLGYTYNMVGKDYKAETLYHRVEHLYQTYPPPSKELGDLYYRFAILMMAKEDPERTIEYYHQALPLYHNDTISLAKIFHNIGLALHVKKDYSEASQSLKKSINLYLQHSTTPTQSLAWAYMNLARIQLDENKTSLAERNFKRSIRMLVNIGLEESPILAYPLYYLGELYEKLKNWSMANLTYQRALAITQKSYGDRHYQTALAYTKMATVELSKDNFIESINYIDHALKCMFPTDSTKAYQDKSSIGSSLAENEIYSILKLKADILHNKSRAENNLDDLQLSLDTYLLAQQWADTVRLKINSEGDKLNYLNKIHGFYPAALEVCWELFQQTGNKQYLDKAFFLVEKSKANLMMENLQEGEALKFAGIGEDLLEEERNLRARLDKLDNDIYDKERSVENEQDSSLQKLRNEAFQLRQQYDSLKTYLVEQHPAYYKLKYDLKVRSIKETQQRLLKPDQAIVEYFVADEYVYIFYISPNTVVFKRVENAAGLVEQVEELRTGLFGWEKTPKSQREDSFMGRHKEMYSNAAYNLYQQLLGPIDEEVALPKKMIIVPDGVLGYIPFDILLKDSIDTSTSYTEYPYLIKTHQFAYCYSTTMLSEMKAIQHEKVRKEMLGIAMSFPVGYLTYDENQSRNQNEESEDLSYLRYTKPELKEIQKLVHGLSLIDSKATKEKVLKLIEQYRILHFSTHGILNDEESNLSYLALAGANRVADTGRLYVRDLYNLRLGASMVVLSACETGLGKIRKGEGIISMSRGFSYAGAKSILTTLWQVNDKSTSEIMVAFYQYLKEGKQKDEALRLAKLDYMKNVHAQSVAHPFYWAASVPIGDMSEMEFTDRSWLNYVWAVAIILVLVLSAWYWRRASA